MYKTQKVFPDGVDTQGLPSPFVPCRHPDKLFNSLFVTVSLIKADDYAKTQNITSNIFLRLALHPFYKTALFQLQITSRLCGFAARARFLSGYFSYLFIFF